MNNSDKREFRRVTGEFEVSYREVIESMFQHLLEAGDFENTPLDELSDEEVFTTTSTDISQGGLGLGGDLRLVGGRPLKSGRRLFVEMAIPGDEKPVRALSTVVWVKPEVPGVPREAGLVFLGVSERDLRRLFEFIEASKRSNEGG